MPTDRGLALFDVLQRADPTLVDPGVTAQMERLLDDVLVGQQKMLGAIDAVCAQAGRIIGRLQRGTTSADVALLSVALARATGGTAGPGAPSRKGRAGSRAPRRNGAGRSPRRLGAPQNEQQCKPVRNAGTGKLRAGRVSKKAEGAPPPAATAGETRCAFRLATRRPR